MIVLRLTLFACALAISLPLRAESEITSAIETGWTSNALGAAGGTDDAYLTQSHTIALVGGGQAISLRAAFGFEDTRYLALHRENDVRAVLELVPEIALSDTTHLRGRFALTYSEEGTQLAPSLGATEPALGFTAAVRSETIIGQGVLGLDLAYGANRPQATRFEADLLPPARNGARTDTLSAGLDITHPIGDIIALSGAIQWRSLMVSQNDQAQFDRLPLHHLRIAAGGEIADGKGTALVLRGGIDALLPAIDGLDAVVLPYGEAEARVQLSPHLALRGSLLAGADLSDPADGYADARLTARAGLLITPAEGWELDIGPFAKTRASVALATSIEHQSGVELAVTRAWERFSIAARLSHSAVTGLAPAYDETRLGLRVAAGI